MESQVFTYMIMMVIMISIIYNDAVNLDFNLYVLLFTSIIFAGTIGVYMMDSTTDKANKLQLFSLGLFIVSVIGYTIYQWKKLSENQKDKCGFILPHTGSFNKSQYYLYRVIYLITIIVIVSLLQFKIEDKSFTLPWVPVQIVKHFVFLIPVIIPLLTETVDTLINDLSLLGTSEISNPESLLSNFFLGDSTKDVFSMRMIGPMLFYILLMFTMVDSSYGITGSWPTKGYMAIYIALCFIIFFSLIMRAIFIQDCSLKEDKNISKIDKNDYTNRFECIFEKYGGLQTMLCTSLIIILIYNIKNPIYKIMFFSIICLASWGLSTTYMLTLK